MHSSALIILNVVKQAVSKGVRKLFILLPPVYILKIINQIQIIKIARRIQYIRLIRILNMDGKSFLAKDYTKHLIETTSQILGSQNFIMYLARMERGEAERIRHRPLC